MTPFFLTASGAAIASAEVPNEGMQVVGLLGVAGATDALNAVVYICPTEPSGSIPAGSLQVATLKCAIGACVPFPFSPDGIAAGGWIAVQFADADTIHSAYVYLK